MKKFLTLLRSGWFMAFIGVVLLSILVWFGGPYLGLGSHHPLASAIARLVLIIIIIAIWAICLQVSQWRARKKANALSSEVAGQSSDEPAAEAGPDQAQGDERAQLQGRFREAVEMLRKRPGGRNLYNMPWYVVIGPPGSGKSTMVQNSGLHFPLSERFGKDALRGVGGTRNCDWWFTDEAVFLDTAGRYTTQDSDRSADAGAWGEFLHLLRKYRKRRPINGVMLTMSVSDLLTLDAEGLQAHIEAVRRRLDELGKELRIGVPVYLVLTKCDLVAGFSEFFDNLDLEQRSQVWGMSFPADATMNGSAAKAFAGEFDLLIEQLNARVLDRLHAERDRGRRASIVSFPLQMGSLRQIARQFVEGVFSGDSYSRAPLLRGVYLTSGTQEGTPIDRMLGAVARAFGLDQTQLPAAAAKPRTFFVEHLLKKVLFNESGFAGTDPKLERRKIIAQIAAYAAIVIITVLLVAGMLTSYGRNKAYLADVHSAIEAYPATVPVEGANDDKTYFAKSLQRLGDMSNVDALAGQYRDDTPWLMRFGLYQGDAVGQQVHDAYLRELNALLLPGVAMRFRRGLANRATDPQALYYYLKGYLMLGQPEHRDVDQLVALTDIEWARIFPKRLVLQHALNKQFAVLMAEPDRLRAISLDDKLVAQARSTLRTADLAALVYGNIKLRESVSSDPPVRLDKELGLLGEVFHRKSGTPLSKPLPALYTQPVFRREVNHGIADAVKQFAANDWVFGATPMDTVAQARMQHRVLELYERDYIKHWDDLLDDLAVQPATSIQDASAVAAKLSGASSPLKALLQLVAANTSDMLRAPDSGSAKTDKAKSVAKKLAARKARQQATRSALTRVLAQSVGSGGGGAAAAKPGDAISEHFADVDKLTAGAAGASPIDHTLSVIGQLSKTLLTMSDFTNSAGQPNPQLLLAQQQVAQLPEPVSGWLGGLTHKSQSLVASGTSKALGNKFKQAVGKSCAVFTHGRFPFVPSSHRDIPLQNFAGLFGYGGRFDAFYKSTLAQLVDASGSRWRWKDGPGAFRGSPGILRRARLADRIKRMYFPNGSGKPKVNFSITNPQLGAGIGKFSIDVDGQAYTYQIGGTPRMAMSWPGPKTGKVTVSAWDTSGSLISTFSYHGDWALFHALRAAHLQKQSDLRYLASFDFGGRKVQVVIQAASLENPFLNKAVQRFRCGG